MPDVQIIHSQPSNERCSSSHPESEYAIGSTADIQHFLSQIRPREQSVLPQNPWTVSAGAYIRLDSLGKHIGGLSMFRDGG
ncbi:hypothetical protein EK21DRAFT_60486 [Setomelanomma holmii]|uniref:Uncharacterized protein n=1 Tax=Setomelanomma holmii TaxID=210430 RepID=A0A9P4LRC6_9PLEO|nr:hypothetical protein EK21DRAFT_60486 [Setomelanomma holmii]